MALYPVQSNLSLLYVYILGKLPSIMEKVGIGSGDKASYTVYQGMSCVCIGAVEIS